MGLDDFSMVNEPIRLGRFNAEASKPRPIKFSVFNVEIKQKVVEESRIKLRKSREERCTKICISKGILQQISERKRTYKGLKDVKTFHLIPLGKTERLIP